jgi:YidC/Oxa1 family membrane protein insertase
MQAIQRIAIGGSILTRYLYKSLPLVVLILFLSGCSSSSGQFSAIDPATANIFTKYFTLNLIYLLNTIAHALWNQYGLAILVVTILIRLIILPLTIKQFRSSKKMQELQPEMKKVKEKYKDDPKKQQEETMKLFQQNGVNPLAGCFPIIVQMPILIALYQSIFHNENMINHQFLWFELDKPEKFVLPILAAITTYVQQSMMSSQMNQQMKMLLYVFPVMIFVMALQFPAALSLYWFYGNLFTIVQTYFLYVRGNKKKGDVTK